MQYLLTADEYAALVPRALYEELGNREARKARALDTLVQAVGAEDRGTAARIFEASRRDRMRRDAESPLGDGFDRPADPAPDPDPTIPIPHT